MTESDAELIKEYYGIDINSPDGIDQLIEALGNDSDGLDGDSEDISCITQDEG